MFLTDVLILLAVANAWAAHSVSSWQINFGKMAFPGWAATAFLLYMGFRAFFGPDFFTLDWARDVVPFLYSALALLSAAGYAASGPLGRAKTMQILWWALNGHLAWTLLVNFGLINPESTPQMPGATDGVTVFAQRVDVDMAVLGMTASLYLRRIIMGKRRLLSAIGMSLSLVALFGLGSRAGLLAALVAMGIVYSCTLVAHWNPRSRLRLLLLAPLTVVLAAVLLPQTEAGQRLLAGSGAIEAIQPHEQGALGTTQSREQAWSQLMEWTNEDPTRAWVGAGFGPNIIQEAGIEDTLSGTDYEGVRSPHSWFVGIYARTGTIGLSFTAVVLAVLLAHMWRIRQLIGSTELLTLAAAGVSAVLVVAALGVVLESPFGAVPFWWFVGLLMAERRTQAPQLSTETPGLVTA
ncbi:O-antigen ligase family protein [Kocuria rhizosphaericola]|uniref:O-antigen ligase family protein n=1 Tax=Kocuria rhizosphaericola TaxID=3376284 RepID=UPI0037A7A97A